LVESLVDVEEGLEEEERVSRGPVVVVVVCICCCTDCCGLIAEELLLGGDRARRLWVLAAVAIRRPRSRRHSLDSIVRGEVCEVD
jgi:hypothetical protein